MNNRSELMKAAWRIYRSRRPVGRLLKVLWREALRNAWGQWRTERTKQRPTVAHPPRDLSPMAAEIDGLKFLPFRYNIASMEQAIRARYATAA